MALQLSLTRLMQFVSEKIETRMRVLLTHSYITLCTGYTALSRYSPSALTPALGRCALIVGSGPATQSPETKPRPKTSSRLCVPFVGGGGGSGTEAPSSRTRVLPALNPISMMVSEHTDPNSAL